ncbi:MAG: Mpo1-like protein [Janthinobacterium lividum]
MSQPHVRREFSTFAEFYPYYLQEHSDLHCRRLHFIGSLGVIGCLAMAIATADWDWLALAAVCGYGFAWVGHYFFEKNRPATFSHPLYSLLGDWMMFKDICTGRILI